MLRNNSKTFVILKFWTNSSRDKLWLCSNVISQLCVVFVSLNTSSSPKQPYVLLKLTYFPFLVLLSFTVEVCLSYRHGWSAMCFSLTCWLWNLHFPTQLSKRAKSSKVVRFFLFFQFFQRGFFEFPLSWNFEFFLESYYIALENQMPKPTGFSPQVRLLVRASHVLGVFGMTLNS